MNAENPSLIALNRSNNQVALIPGQTENQLIETHSASALSQVDVIFPIVHGTLGKTVPCRGCCAWQILPSWGPACWVPP